MKFLKIITICVITLISASCGTINKTKSYSYDSVRLEMNMNDLIYLGESDISVEYSSYIWGLFSSIDKVNGEIYNPVHKKSLHLPTQSSLFSDDKLNIAAYQLLEKYPEGVYFQVVLETLEKEKLFLGSLNKKIAKVRVYKFKH